MDVASLDEDVGGDTPQDFAHVLNPRSERQNAQGGVAVEGILEIHFHVFWDKDSIYPKLCFGG